MVNIRNFKNEDYDIVNSWWKKVGEIGPTIDYLPEESSFILEIDNNPCLCISVYLTNTPSAYFENLIADPEFKDRKYAAEILLKHAFNFAKNKGYKYALGFTNYEKLATRHLEMGWQKKKNTTVVFKELK